MQKGVIGKLFFENGFGKKVWHVPLKFSTFLSRLFSSRRRWRGIYMYCSQKSDNSLLSTRIFPSYIFFFEIILSRGFVFLGSGVSLIWMFAWKKKWILDHKSSHVANNDGHIRCSQFSHVFDFLWGTEDEMSMFAELDCFGYKIAYTRETNYSW